MKSRVIVIIGGTSGLGLSGAKACLESGASVVAVGLDDASVSEARAALGERALVFQADATLPDTAERAIREGRGRFGGFDGLYHVAGGSGRKWGDGPLHELSDEGWEKTIALNQSSVFYSNRAAVRAFLEEDRGGSVLNLSSALAAPPSPGLFSTFAYASAKSAVSAMTRHAASRYASANIRFNAIAPGLVDTPMSKRARADEAVMAYVERKQPLDGGRIGMPSDLDALVVYFLSDASRFVTGQVLSVDGGWSVTDAGRI